MKSIRANLTWAETKHLSRGDLDWALLTIYDFESGSGRKTATERTYGRWKELWLKSRMTPPKLFHNIDPTCPNTAE